MGINNNRDAKFDTSKAKLIKVWDEIQRVQTDFCFAQEISVYYMCNQWINDARSVLDVGTGNGYYLSKIYNHFPKKEYHGIDMSNEFIEIAKSTLSSTTIDFKKENYFNVSGVYDFVIMRLFWQHLPQSRLNEAFGKLEEITRPGSCVLVVDAFDDARCFVPDLIEFQKVIAAYKSQQSSERRDRNIIQTLVDLAERDKNWKLSFNISLILPSTIPGNLDLYRRIYELWIELFECLGDLDIDFNPAKQELLRWRENDRAFTQAGLHVIRLDRIA